jgi:hypothetical protein
MKSNTKLLVLLKELSKSIDHAAYILHKITGEDINLIKKLSKDEIMQKLSVALHKMEKEDHELNWRNDKSSEKDEIVDSHAYEKEAKGIVSKKTKSFPTQKQVYEFLKIFSALSARKAMIYGLSSASMSSNPYNADMRSQITISNQRLNLSNIIPTAKNASNDNYYAR